MLKWEISDKGKPGESRGRKVMGLTSCEMTMIARPPKINGYAEWFILRPGQPGLCCSSIYILQSIEITALGVKNETGNLTLSIPPPVSLNHRCDRAPRRLTKYPGGAQSRLHRPGKNS